MGSRLDIRFEELDKKIIGVINVVDSLNCVHEDTKSCFAAAESVRMTYLESRIDRVLYKGVADSVDKNDDQNVHTKKKNRSSSLESHVEGGNDSIGYLEWTSPTVGGYTSICAGTYDAGEGGQEANLEDFQKISTVQVTTIVNLDDDSVVSTRQVNEHTNVSSHHQVGNIILYKRKKKFHTASPPHSEVQTQNEQGSSPKTFGESGVGNVVIEDVYPLLSYSPQIMTLPGDMEYGVFAVGDRTRENVEPLLTDPLQTHTLPFQQGESLVGEERMEAHESVSLDPIKAATRKTLGTELLSAQVQSSVGDGRMEEGYSDALQSTGVPADAKIEPEQVVLDTIEATSNVPATEQVSLELKTYIGDGGRDESDSVAPQSTGVFADAEVLSEQVESPVRDRIIEECDLFVSNQHFESIEVPTGAYVCVNVECSTVVKCLAVGDKPIQLRTKVSNDDGEKTPIIFSGFVPKVAPVVAIPKEDEEFYHVRFKILQEELNLGVFTPDKKMFFLNCTMRCLHSRMRDKNCDRFVVKFADMIINGENVMDWDTDDVLDYMETWSVNLYSHAKNKLVEGYETTPESAGHDYHDNNNMECTFGNRKRVKRAKKQTH
ncbi:hypothetical protein K7X08_037206 [Anisodus acutangulus]|uniref:Uncharacterized protein n=1 Tax=Anisodus acutangulus TaxID=402998 RepID=A0A9Q1L0X2_9SOLA|nr:hypothetical protein K7X08_037206 [Anisodus acutangulus]